MSWIGIPHVDRRIILSPHYLGIVERPFSPKFIRVIHFQLLIRSSSSILISVCWLSASPPPMVVWNIERCCIDMDILHSIMLAHNPQVPGSGSLEIGNKGPPDFIFIKWYQSREILPACWGMENNFQLWLARICWEIP
jgi:hypothetical protein